MKRPLTAALALFCGLAPLVDAAPPDYPQPTGRTFAHTFPYSMIGQLLFDNGPRTYSGTGTVIRPYSVVTAGHNLYDFDQGWSTNFSFRRGQYGDTAISEKIPNRLFVLAGYQTKVAYYGGDSVRSFSADTGALRFGSPVAKGAYSGWSTDISLVTGAAYKIALGYGAEFKHTGDDLLFVEPAQSFYQTFNAFYENDTIYIERGMSGGPLFAEDDDGNTYVCGTIVSGAEDPVSGGVRIFNQKVADLIRNYLR
jgi:V8-like Glu-specific endopeptidase